MKKSDNNYRVNIAKSKKGCSFGGQSPSIEIGEYLPQLILQYFNNNTLQYQLS